MSDRVAIMCDGQLVQVASPEDLYRHPVNAYVAGFLGEANLLPTADGRILDDATDAAFAGTAVLRPEDLVLVSASEATPAWSVEGTVRLLSFQGTRFRLELQTDGGRKVVCSLPTALDVSALGIGSRVRVACRNPERVHVIPAAEQVARQAVAA